MLFGGARGFYARETTRTARLPAILEGCKVRREWPVALRSALYSKPHHGRSEESPLPSAIRSR